MTTLKLIRFTSNSQWIVLSRHWARRLGLRRRSRLPSKPATIVWAAVLGNLGWSAGRKCDLRHITSWAMITSEFSGTR